MANQIEYTAGQSYEYDLNNSQYYQGWDFNPASPINFNYLMGLDEPDPTSVIVTIRDYITLDTTGQYESYEVDVSVVIEDDNPTNTIFLNVTGDITPANNPYILTLNNLEPNLVVSIINAPFLTEGVYKGYINFRVFGVNGGVRTPIDKETLEVCLQVVPPGQMILDPEQTSFIYALGVQLPNPSNVKLITDVEFEIKTPLFIDITGVNIVLIETTEEYKIYSGFGLQNIGIAINNLAYDEPFGLCVAQLVLSNDFITGQIYDVFLNFLEEVNLEAIPTQLDFFAVRGIIEAEGQIVTVVSPLAYSIESPPWLNIIIGQSDLFSFEVKPFFASNFINGTYYGEIKITSPAGNATINVKHEVVDGAFFNTNQFINWCRDETKFSRFFAQNTNSIAQLGLKIRAENPNTSEEIEDSIFLKLAFYKNESKLHLGDIIKRFFAPPINSNTYNVFSGFLLNTSNIFNYGKPAMLRASYNVDTNGTTTDEIQEFLQDALFVDGRKPELSFDSFAILQASQVIIRVTRKTKAIFSFINLVSTITIKEQKNYEEVLPDNIIMQPNTNQKIFGKIISFNDLEPGDRYRLYLNKGEDTLYQEYVVFPDGLESTHIMWLNEFQTQHSFEFTGQIKIDTSFDQITFKSYKDLVEHINKTDVTRDVRIMINTGWILKSNQLIIDELIASKNAEIYFENSTETIAAIPIGKKIINEDSLESLYQYEVEFIINKTNALRNYTS